MGLTGSNRIEATNEKGYPVHSDRECMAYIAWLLEELLREIKQAQGKDGFIG